MFGEYPSVATTLPANGARAASASPPPVSMSRVLVEQADASAASAVYLHGGFGSMLRPRSHVKSHPWKAASAASSISRSARTWTIGSSHPAA
jgi:hypothetical protein